MARFTVLIVDDEKTLARSIKLFLIEQGCEAEVADDGVSVSRLYLGFVDTGFAGRMPAPDGEVSSGIAGQLRRVKQMTVADSARLIANATYGRKRTVYTHVDGLPGWLFPWFKLLLPGYLEKVGKGFMEAGGI